MKNPSSRNDRLRRRATLLSALALAIFAAGCASTPVGLPKPLPDREARMKYGYLYYLDGAGGGTAKNNWAAGVREGLLAAGYRGAGEMFSWEEGRGLLVDQDASVKYKRGKADLMAKELVRQKKAFPNAPVNILGFSAGTAEAIFALEALRLIETEASRALAEMRAMVRVLREDEPADYEPGPVAEDLAQA